MDTNLRRDRVAVRLMILIMRATVTMAGGVFWVCSINPFCLVRWGEELIRASFRYGFDSVPSMMIKPSTPSPLGRFLVTNRLHIRSRFTTTRITGFI